MTRRIKRPKRTDVVARPRHASAQRLARSLSLESRHACRIEPNTPGLDEGFDAHRQMRSREMDGPNSELGGPGVLKEYLFQLSACELPVDVPIGLHGDPNRRCTKRGSPRAICETFNDALVMKFSATHETLRARKAAGRRYLAHHKLLCNCTRREVERVAVDGTRGYR